MFVVIVCSDALMHFGRLVLASILTLLSGFGIGHDVFALSLSASSFFCATEIASLMLPCKKHFPNSEV